MAEISKVAIITSGLAANTTTYNNDFDVGSLYVGRSSPGSGGTQLTKAILDNLILYGQTAMTSLTGDVTATGPGASASTISAGVVTLAKMANLAANSIIGNNTGSPATPIALTSTQVTAMLNVFTSGLQGLVPASGGGTTNFLRADGTFAAPSGTGGTVTSVALADGSSSPIYTISGSPVISAGTLTFSLSNQSANQVFSGPSTGSPAQPTFRSLVSADIPSLAAIYLPLAGGTMSGSINMGSNSITSLASPVNPNDAVNKAYVDNFINATSWKNAVLVATTANITLSGEQTIDGFLTSSSRVLVKNQTLSQNNGIYISNSGAWTRSLDMDSWSEVPAAAVFVQEGTINGDLGFVCTSQPGGTLGTTPITFVQFSSAGSYSADNVTLQLISNVFSVKNGGISDAQVNAAAAIAYSKLALTNSIVNADINSAAAIAYSKLNLSNSIVAGDLTAASVTNAKINTNVFDQVTITGGAGVPASVVATGAVVKAFNAGLGVTFAANTSYLVRMGRNDNSETIGAVYPADNGSGSGDAATNQNFWVIGIASSTTTVTAGQSINVTLIGNYLLASSDASFVNADTGHAVWLQTGGGFSTTAPTASGSASVKVGSVSGGGGAPPSAILINGIQLTGIN